MFKKPKLVLEGKALRGDEQCGIYFCDSLIGVSLTCGKCIMAEKLLIFLSLLRWLKFSRDGSSYCNGTEMVASLARFVNSS